MNLSKRLIELQTKFIEIDMFTKRHDEFVQQDSVKKEIKNLICMQKKIFNIHNELLHIDFSNENELKKHIACYCFKKFNEAKEQHTIEIDSKDLQLAQNEAKSFRELFQTLYQNVDSFAKVVYKYLKDKSPKDVDEITIATIPGLFGSLNNMSSIKTYLTFIAEMVKIEKEDDDFSISAKFARPLFIIPGFLKFLRSIIHSCSKQIDKVESPENAKTFISNFSTYIRKYAAFCPFFVKDLLMLVPEEKMGQFLYSSFLSEMCHNPISFNIVKNFSITGEAANWLDSEFKDISDALAGFIIKVEKPLQSPHDSKIEIKEEIVALTKNDIKYLKEIVSIASKENYFYIDAESFNKITIGNEISDNDYVILFPQFRDTSLSCERSKAESDPDEEDETQKFVSAIVNILISIDQIPEGMPIDESSASIVQFLRAISDRTFKLQRIMLEMQIENLKDKDKPLSETVSLLEKYFESKKETIKQYLKEMSLFSSASNEAINQKKRLNKYLNNKINVLAFKIIENWVTKEKLFEIIDSKKEVFCTNSDAFFEDFKKFLNDFNAKCGDYKINSGDAELILFDIVMSHISLQDFMGYHRDFTAEDERITAILRTNGIAEKFFGTEKKTVEKSKKKYAVFLKSPKVLSQPKETLELIPQLSTPLQKFDCFVKANKEFIIIGGCEISDFGADDKQPTRLILMSYAKKFTPVAFTCLYISHFMGYNKNDAPDQLAIKSSSIDMSDLQSILGYFKDFKLEDPEPQELTK